MSNIRRILLAGGLATVSSGALATACDSALSNYEFYVSIGDRSNAGDILGNHPECFGGGATTSRVQITGTSFEHAAAISNAISSRRSGNGPGLHANSGTKSMAAGGVSSAWNVWGHVVNNDTRQSYTAPNSFNTRNSSDILTTVVGGDYALSSTMVVGVSASFDDGDGYGRNASPTSVRNNTGSHGYLVAPYLGMQLSREWAFDASLGFGSGKISSSNNTAANADRWFAAGNFVYDRWVGNFQFTGKASYLHGEENYGNTKDTETGLTFAGTDARNKLDQLRLGVQAGYWMNGFMPYAALGYTNDFHRSTSQFGASGNPLGKDAWVWSLGVNFFSLANGLTGGVAYRQEEGRSHQKNDSLMANINFRF